MMRLLTQSLSPAPLLFFFTILAQEPKTPADLRWLTTITPGATRTLVE